MAIITLHYSVSSIITSVPDQISYLFRHFVYNPGFTSERFPDMEISLRGMVSKTPTNPQAAGEAIATSLRRAINRVIPDMEINVDVGIVFNDTSFYKVKIKITDSSGNNLIPIGLITVKDQMIALEFEGI